jgi:hypothetical protein
VNALQPQCCSCGGNHTANYHGCVKWKEAKAAFAKRAPKQSRISTATSNPAAPNPKQAGPSFEPIDLGEGWSHVVKGGSFQSQHSFPYYHSKSSTGHGGS